MSRVRIIDGKPATQRPQLLLLTHRVPHPPDRGDRIRSYQILKFLAARADVHLACLADEAVSDETATELGRLCSRVAIGSLDWRRWLNGAWSMTRGRTATEGLFASRSLRRTVCRWSRETPFDGVLVYCSSMVPYARARELSAVPKVVDLVDVDSEKWFKYAARSRMPVNWMFGLEGKRLRRLEKSLVSWVRGLTLISREESRLFSSFAPETPVNVVSNGVDLDYFRPNANEVSEVAPCCVFVGVLDYRPNADGLHWFCHHVWAGVRDKFPQAIFSIVGRRPSDKVRSLARLPGVELVGDVPDVRPYVARAAVSVAPLWIARGVQNKVLEALAMGKAVVASPPAVEGLEVSPGTHLLQAETPEQWIACLTKLLSDADSRRALGAAGRQHVAQVYHWERRLEPLEGLLGLGSRSAQFFAGSAAPHQPACL